MELTLQREALKPGALIAGAAAAAAAASSGHRAAMKSTTASSSVVTVAVSLDERHVLRASLAPDGASRTFQLDGRSRTAQQVKVNRATRFHAIKVKM